MGETRCIFSRIWIPLENTERFSHRWIQRPLSEKPQRLLSKKPQRPLPKGPQRPPLEHPSRDPVFVCSDQVTRVVDRSTITVTATKTENEIHSRLQPVFRGHLPRVSSHLKIQSSIR